MDMKHPLSIWIVLLLSGLPCSCVDEIALPVSEEGQGKLVVEGRAVKGSPSRVFVRLSRTAELSVHGVPTFVEDGDVRLQNRTGQNIALAHQNRGYYTAELTPDSPMDLQTGQSYQLQISLPDGSRYQSAWELLAEVPELDSISFSEVNKRILNDAGNIVTIPFVQYQITTSLVPAGHTTPSPLLWEAEGVFRLYESPTLLNPRICYITEPVGNGRTKVLSELSNDQVALIRYPILEREIDWHFATGYFLTLYQYSLSRDAAQYWSQVGQIIQRDGGLYEKPPGSIAGNISNADNPGEQVLGYFFASAVDTSRLLITPDELSVTFTSYCHPDYGDGGDVCFDCLQWPRSTLERPSYW